MNDITLLIGKTLNEAKKLHSGPIRIRVSGERVTTDYFPSRLNVWLTKDGLIEKVTLG